MSKNIEFGAHVFLFNSDTPELGGYYGYPCNKALFDSVLKENAAYPIYSRIFCGDMLLHNLCKRIKEVKQSGDRASTMYTVDMDLYTTVITELAHSIKERYNTISIPDLPMLLGRHNIYCIVLTNLPYASRGHVDESVKELKGYIGVFELDMGNPLHIELFIRNLIQIGFLNANILFLEEGYDLEENFAPDWTKDNPMVEVKFISYEEYQLQVPPLVFLSKVSKRGEIFLNIMTVKGKKDHYQKIASGLKDSKGDFQFTVNGKLSFNNVKVPKEKLTEYALNFEHKGDGKSKAKLFRDLLGITRDNWRYLAAQLENGLADGVLNNVRRTNYGIQYHIDIPVKGLNGVSKTVRTAWITLDNTTISLTTAYIADKKYQHNIEGEAPFIVNNTKPEQFWEELYNFACKEAMRVANEVIPTPMYISGYPEPIMSGKCGFAYVVVKDARKGFAKWLKNNKIGHQAYKGGWEISAGTHDQSFEKAKAYVETFEKILRQNGVECYSTSRFD